MKNSLSSPGGPAWSRVSGLLVVLVTMCFPLFSALAQPTNQVRILEFQGTVQFASQQSATWSAAQTNQVLAPSDRLRTGPNSRVALKWSDNTVLNFGPATELEILPAHAPGAESGLSLVRGIASFFHRGDPGRIRVLTHGAVAGIEGTEFVVSVADINGTDRTTLSVIDGKVSFGNDQAMLVLTNNEQAVVDAGRAPTRTAGFVANNLLQWAFYYPGVLDLADLPLTPDELNTLSASLAAYRSGAVLEALDKYPAGRQPASDAERIYHSALLLSVGQVEGVEAELSAIDASDSSAKLPRLAASLRELIAAVKHQTLNSLSTPELPTELLARSYYEQSLADAGTSLETALGLAKQAAERSPEFAFAWARVAELKFSFGHTKAAMEAVNHSLDLAPKNAQALTLKGFLVAAQNNSHEALKWFDRALSIDGALANAWLGRGLCRIRLGDAKAGREDLLVAAALEPQRAGLRSYLGKAFGDAGDFHRASKELALAKQLDPNDPTAPLYSALLNHQHNRVNEAIRDLEHSQELNDNRSVYRSQLLLDEDRAVRSASLATIYEDAGMSDVSFREAARAVNSDYGNFSAHLFLADSLSPRSDVINRRYETAANLEFVVANLLAPPGTPTLSAALSQSEYSRLFERNRVGLVSTTEYLSRGAWTESGAQYGTTEKFSYDVNWDYRSDPGERSNNDFEWYRLGMQFRVALTPQDSAYLYVEGMKYDSGDIWERYDPEVVSKDHRAHETENPMAIAGYHHEWSPGVHTLFLVAHYQDTLSFTNSYSGAPLVFWTDASDPGPIRIIGLRSVSIPEDFKGNIELYSAELQQIWQKESHTTILGGRAQYGEFDTYALLAEPWGLHLRAFFRPPPAPASEKQTLSRFERASIYGYHQWEIIEPLQIIGGMTYDHLKFPENFRIAPISDEEKTMDRVSPKAGLIWTPLDNTTMRFAYTRSLGGASADQSIQIEPSQVAGFVQSFRSIIPESVVGGNAGAEFETYGLSLEQKFPTGTYVGVSGEILNSQIDRVVGAFAMHFDQSEWAIPSGLRNRLDYEERSILVTINQLLGNEWALGTRYKVSQAVLEEDFLDIPDILAVQDFPPRKETESILHELDCFVVFNHASGLFARAEANWFMQENYDYSPDLPGDDFWHLNVMAGYRLPGRKAELQAALLNITDQDYRLSPLNLYRGDLPRNRTLAIRLRVNF